MPPEAWRFWRSSGDERAEGDLFSIGRPGNTGGRVLKVGKFCTLARIHPVNVELRLPVTIRDVSEPSAVRRPARRGIAICARGKRTVLGAIKIHNPEVCDAAIRTHVGGLAHVHNAFAVRGNLRIGSYLQTKNIHGLQPIGNLLSPGAEGKEETKQQRLRVSGVLETRWHPFADAC